ncbi:MAG: hypothetical protein ACI9EF_000004 [Pseudohongiellaceae bacterium]
MSKAKASSSSRKSAASKKAGGAAKPAPPSKASQSTESAKAAKAAKKTPKKATSKKASASKASAPKTPAKKTPAPKAASKAASKVVQMPTPTQKAVAAAKKLAAAASPPKSSAKPAAKPTVKTPPKTAEPVEVVSVEPPKPAPKPVKRSTAPAKPKRKRSSKVILAEARENLDRIYGPIALPETADILEKAVYLVLREGGTELTTTKAMKALKAEFVDWNEVRVSRSSELARLMSGTSKVAGIRRFHERSTRLREMIDQIYGDRNETSLEFLLEEKPKGQLEYLEDFDDLGLHNAYALVQWLHGKDDIVLVSAEMASAASMLGLIDTPAVTKAKKSLNEMCKNRIDRVTLVAHLNKLGDLEYKEWPSAMKEMMN